eukprot:TRINITY_DN7055_c0_g1_i6.p1 TRINITY_DN7055_c0_g1~~TRINITY_DN7055_c0_g1_i6.p1  ORF type:complete len:303 (-),score=36.14 TRINITY_DN7055_c0_g1_i6:105-1013(-)
MVFLNKTVMKNLSFPYPLFMTWVQLLVAAIFIFGCGLVEPVLQRPISFLTPVEWNWGIARSIFPLSLVWVCNMVTTNVALNYTEVTFFQLVRGLTIVWSIVLQQINFPDMEVSMKTKFACSVVVFGFVMGSVGEVNFNWVGWSFGVASSIFASFYGILVKKSLAHVNGSMWRLMIYTTSFSVLLFLPLLFLSGEISFFDNSTFFSLLTPTVMWAILASGVVGYVINIATFLQLKMTTPLSSVISGSVKGVLQTLLGWVVWRNEISDLNGLGIAFTMVGSTWYSYLQYERNMQAKPKESKTDV